MKLFFLTLLTCGSMLAAAEVEKIFTHIYDAKVWGENQEGDGFSGSGSTDKNTALYRLFLENFIAEHEIKSVVDVGCGDWTFSKKVDWGAARYIGCDVVKSVIERNQRAYANEMVSFVHANCIEDALPAGELLICKEVLQHLPNQDVARFLHKMRQYKYCVIINDVDPNTMSSNNPDIQAGGYRHLDLTRPPFNLNAVKILSYISMQPDNSYHTKLVLFVYNNAAPPLDFPHDSLDLSCRQHTKKPRHNEAALLDKTRRGALKRATGPSSTHFSESCNTYR